MMNRRKLLTNVVAGVLGLALVGTVALADELLGTITKVDIAAKKLTVEPKDGGKDVEVTVTDDTEYVTGKGSSKIDLEKVSKNVAKQQDAGKKGVNVTITHDKGVASKIVAAKKKVQ
jgi:hypothetical protein